MPKLRRLSGHEVVAQRGGHVKLKRVRPEGAQVLTVPTHASLDIGTLRAILRQASRFIPEDQLHPHFYHP